MTRLVAALTLTLGLIYSGMSFSAPPVISYNVTVAQNATSSQCNGSWEGQTSPEIVETLSGFGSNADITSPVIRTCTGCSVVGSANDCICKTCYDHFN